ncbi:MAG: hypothetical protein M1308_18925, partial [Actinobacteria bacterium]|nr:hypothetical protein [Actinomycetota bacterium]
ETEKWTSTYDSDGDGVIANEVDVESEHDHEDEHDEHIEEHDEHEEDHEEHVEDHFSVSLFHVAQCHHLLSKFNIPL